MDSRRSTEIFTAFAIGIGIGAVAGILFAPQSGEETRDYILKGARDAVETGKDYARRAQEGIGQVKEQAKERVKAQVANAADAADRAYHEVSDAAEAADVAYHKAKGA